MPKVKNKDNWSNRKKKYLQHYAILFDLISSCFRWLGTDIDHNLRLCFSLFLLRAQYAVCNLAYIIKLCIRSLILPTCIHLCALVTFPRCYCTVNPTTVGYVFFDGVKEMHCNVMIFGFCIPLSDCFAFNLSKGLAMH